jgi:hypothetical protein
MNKKKNRDRFSPSTFLGSILFQVVAGTPPELLELQGGHNQRLLLFARLGARHLRQGDVLFKCSFCKHAAHQFYSTTQCEVGAEGGGVERRLTGKSSCGACLAGWSYLKPPPLPRPPLPRPRNDIGRQRHKAADGGRRGGGERARR